MPQNIKIFNDKKLGVSKDTHWLLYRVIFNTIRNIFKGFSLILKFLLNFSEKSTMIRGKNIRLKYPYFEARTVFFPITN